MPVTYQQTTDREIHERVRRKHWTSINELKRLGFEEAYFFGETVQALGFSPLGLAGFLGTLIAMLNEVAKVEGNLNVSVFNVVMASKEYATYACPFGLGVKFYTSFTDGTCVITANFESPPINDEKEKLYKSALPQTIVTAWPDHKKLVDKLRLEGKQKIEHLSFAGYLQLAQKEDEYMLKRKNRTIMGGLFLEIISTIIALSPIISVVGLGLVGASLLQKLYPACLIYGDKASIWQNLLMAFVPILVGWILARFQKNMFTVNGSGTKLFGRFPIANSQEYVSTKWLTLLIPLLPVRSYRIMGEQSGPLDKTYYAMTPLERLDWGQVRQTLREWWWGYLIFILIMIGFITLPIWKCL
jgi:hypothetical protein